MTGRDLTEFLSDILEAIEEIELFTAGVTLEEFSCNRERTGWVGGER
jgi:uncharacterized protein with HEPN domain